MAIVALYDIDEREVAAWARKNCPSFRGWMYYENESLYFGRDKYIGESWDFRFEFEFTDEQEAMFFQLKWGGSYV